MTNRIFTIISMICFCLLIGCSGDSDPNLTNLSNDLNQKMVEGRWEITLFSDSGKDETNHFSGYQFVFTADKLVSATKASSVINGSWSIVKDQSSDDSVEDLHFNIVFSAPDSFEDLTEDWQFISQTDQKIELIHISGGNGGTDYLTFQKL